MEDKDTRREDLLKVFDRAMEVDAKQSGIGFVNVLFGSRKRYRTLLLEAFDSMLVEDSRKK